MAPWLLLPWILLYFDTLRPREKDGSEGVALAQEVILAHSATPGCCFDNFVSMALNTAVVFL